MEGNYTVNYEDERFAEVEADKEVALKEVEDTYQGMINDSDSYYQAQIDANKQWEDKQTQLQQEQTDFAIEKIEQEKAQAQKDYTKEQSGAYVDWQKQSDQHGVRAEQIADMGMQNTGYSESSQVSMYNTYQNRVATAREAFGRAVQDYNNAITQARLQNNSVLAEIAANALQQRLALSLQGFQYKNQLLLELSDKKMQTENLYYQRYQDVLAQINQENALAEQIRQFNIEHGIGGGGGGGYTGPWPPLDPPDDPPETDGDGKPLDIQSVLELRKGPISAEELVRLEKDGEVMIVETEDRYVAVPKPSTDPLAGGVDKYGTHLFVTTNPNPTTSTTKSDNTPTPFISWNPNWREDKKQTNQQTNQQTNKNNSTILTVNDAQAYLDELSKLNGK